MLLIIIAPFLFVEHCNKIKVQPKLFYTRKIIYVHKYQENNNKKKCTYGFHSIASIDRLLLKSNNPKKT